MRKTTLLELVFIRYKIGGKHTINNQHQKCQCWVQEEGEDEDGRDLTLRPPFSLSQNQQTQQQNDEDDDDDGKAEEQEEGEDENRARGRGRGNWTIVLLSSLVGLLTGIGVVLFNYSGGMPQRGVSWLREEFMGDTWKQVILVPASGGMLSENGSQDNNGNEQGGEKGETLLVKMGMPVSVFYGIKAASRPFFKAIAASPEGPSVEIGTSVAKDIGFNAAVSGCFFAVELVLWPSPPDSSSISLANTTSMVIRSAVIASVVSKVGLGSEPAFKVPQYDFRSPTAAVLIMRRIRIMFRASAISIAGCRMWLGSLTLSKCTLYMLVFVDNLHKTVGLPKFLFPIVGGLAIGLMALAYTEILYRGLSADLLLQLVVVKIGATSLCRASRLVGGYYAPSLFICAATGISYGKNISSAVAQSNPILPSFRLGSSIIASIRPGNTRRKVIGKTKKLKQGNISSIQQPEVPSPTTNGISSSSASAERTSNASELCEIESSLCIDGSDTSTEQLEKRTFVSEAMRTK
ncbi:unnamed protein product [Malus baccata var. baccata]